MSRLWCAVLVLAGLLLAVPGVGRGQVAPGGSPVTLRTPGGEVTLLADRLEQVGPGLFVASGNVEIARGTTRLLADRVQIDRDTGEAVAEGRVIFYDGDDRLTGERIEYNFKTGTGVMHRGEARAAPYYRLAGERMERVDEKSYRIHRGVFTTCEDETPEWSFRFGSATVDLEDFVYGTNASFWVKNIPLVPFFPFFAAAIRRERQTGFLFPRLGSSTRKGFFAQIPFFWAISESQDATLRLDGYSRRGVGLDAEYRYMLSESQRGSVGGFLIQETEVAGETRGWWALKHEWQIAPRLSFKADISGVGDDRVLREYSDRLHLRSLQRVESNVFLTRTWDTWNLVADLFWYQDLVSRRPVELNRLPDIRLLGTRQPVPGVPGLLWELDTSAVYFVRDVGSEGVRVDVHPRLSRPISPAGLFTVTPFVGARLTGYDKTVNGVRTTRDVGVVVEATEDEPRVRRLVEAGTDVETRASRVFTLGGWGGFESWLHSIEPRLNYAWIDGEDLGRLPNWTETVDSIRPASVFTYSLTNRVRAKTVAPNGTEAVTWEMVRLVLGNSFDVNKDQRPVGPLSADLIVDPNRLLRFRGDSRFNVYGDGFESGTTDVSLLLAPLTASIGTRFNRADHVNFLQGGLTAEVSRYLLVRGTTNWDLRTDTFVENRLALDLRFKCWALTVEYIARNRDEDEFRFAVNLLGLGGPVTAATGPR